MTLILMSREKLCVAAMKVYIVVDANGIIQSTWASQTDAELAIQFVSHTPASIVQCVLNSQDVIYPITFGDSGARSAAD